MKEPLQSKGELIINGMNVLRIELIREIGNVKTYKITYEENESIETRLVCRTFNYEEDAENFPESVLDFAEKWILGEL
jgi:hypothetical protein